jgi:hypothetical protein
LGRYLPSTQVTRFLKLHRAIKAVTIRSPDFDSRVPTQRLVIRDVLTDLFPSQWYARGFFLFDICEFSRRMPAEQVTLRLALEVAIRRAVVTLKKENAGVDCNINLIPTGDGYYLWHRNAGRSFDAIVFAIGALALANARSDRLSAIELNIRTAFVIDRMFTIPLLEINQAFGVGSVFRDAVGPALNNAARLCAAAAPNQMLMGVFSEIEEVESGETIRTPANLVAAANALISNPATFALTIDPDEAFRVVDKHSAVHRCVNVRGTCFYYVGTKRQKVDIGLRQDLSKRLDPEEFIGS